MTLSVICDFTMVVDQGPTETTHFTEPNVNRIINKLTFVQGDFIDFDKPLLN